jgi:hypothetical protein
MLGNLLGCFDDEAHVGIFRLVQRRRDTDDDGIGLGKHGRVGRGTEATRRDVRSDVRRRHVRDVRFARVD